MKNMERQKRAQFSSHLVEQNKGLYVFVHPKVVDITENWMM